MMNDDMMRLEILMSESKVFTSLILYFQHVGTTEEYNKDAPESCDQTFY